jgi:hypothetical protein
MSSALSISTDRRAVLFGLSAAAATASFAPFVTASAASAAPAAVASLGTPVTALYWSLPYNDFTGLTAGLKAAKRKAETVLKDLDPHAELLAG